MKKNIYVLALFFAATWLGLIQNAAADNTMKVKWRIAGTLINSVDVTEAVNFTTAPHVLIHLKAKGSPGRAEIRVLSRTGPIPSGGCLNGGGLVFDFVQNDLVATFNDLSMLLATLDGGSLCLNLASGESEAEIDMVIIGGTGRFAGATGTLSTTITTRPLNVEGTFSAETGTVTGTVIRP